MTQPELKNLMEETLKFDTLDDAFDDFIYDFTIDDLMTYLSTEEKERIIKLSPSYIKHKNKWYFNGNFQDLTKEEINKVLNKLEGEV